MSLIIGSNIILIYKFYISYSLVRKSLRDLMFSKWYVSIVFKVFFSYIIRWDGCDGWIFIKDEILIDFRNFVCGFKVSYIF